MALLSVLVVGIESLAFSNNVPTDYFVWQNATKSLIRVCQQIGPDSTALHVLPKLKELFDEFAFSQKNTYSVNLTGNMSGSKVKVGEEDCIENRMDLV